MRKELAGRWRRLHYEELEGKRDHLEELGVVSRVILEGILGKWCGLDASG
jgi:hypothetical protein